METLAFGRTGHESTRVIFGAAALGAMSQERADTVLDLIVRAGVNHIDVAASYGDAELRLAPFLSRHRREFFLATKTGERSGPAARAQLERSLERMGVGQVDLIQLHNLTDEAGWQEAMSPGGALEALVQARSEGLTRFIGVTGHGTYAPAMHLRSLGEYDFDSVLMPYNFALRQIPEYRSDQEELIETCARRQVAVQTIKAIARRRWREGDLEKRYSWYMPIRDEAPLRRAVAYVIGRPGIFLNSTSDATVLPAVLEMAQEQMTVPSDAEMEADRVALGLESLFIRGVTDDVRA